MFIANLVAIKVLTGKPLKQFDAKQFDKVIPGCEQYEPQSLDYHKCAARHVTLTTRHPAGTCRMGSEDDPMAVVDSKLRYPNIQIIIEF